MNHLVFLLMLAIVTEAVLQYGKEIARAVAGRQAKTAVTQVCGLALGVSLTLLCRASVFSEMPGEMPPVMGQVLSGIFISRGANYVSDWIKWL